MRGTGVIKRQFISSYLNGKMSTYMNEWQIEMRFNFEI